MCLELAKIKYGTSQEAAQVKADRPIVFCKELEHELVYYCIAMEGSFFKLTCLYNVDEIGNTIVQSKAANVIGLRVKRQVSVLTSAESGALVAFVVCMNGVGSFLPSLIHTSKENMNYELQRGVPSGTIFTTHYSGWIQTNIFTM